MRFWYYTDVGSDCHAVRPLRGVAVGMPHVAGMTSRYNPQLLDIVGARVGGEPLQLDRKYVVAAIDLEFYDFVDYLAIPQEQIGYEVPTIMPEVMEDFIVRHSPVSAPVGNRIIVYK